MIITKSRIRSLNSNIYNIKIGEKITIAIPFSNTTKDTLINCGFSPNLEQGELVLPTPIGNITKFNAHGKYVKHTDQDKETAYRQAEWTRTDWGGYEHSGICEIPYKRYPRTFIEPPSIELSLVNNSNNDSIVISPEFEFTNDNEEILVHVINLFLEIFKEAHILNFNLDNIIKCPVKKLNWEVLPSGEVPFESVKQGILDRVKDGNKPVITERLEAINKHNPEFVAVGKAGFSGYLIFSFPNKNIYILESNEVNNATYIIDSSHNWEYVSSLTKAEILNNNLHKDRIIHRENWFSKMNALLAQ